MSDVSRHFMHADKTTRPPIVKVGIGGLLLLEIKGASSVFELRLIGEKILRLKIDDELPELILAWQDRWKILSTSVGRPVETEGLYSLVLEDLRHQEVTKRREAQLKVEAFRDSVDAMERLVRSS